MEKLTKLEIINCSGYEKTPVLLLEILHDLTMLETLEFENLMIHDIEYFSFNRRVSTVRLGRLKSIHLNNVVLGASYSILIANRLLAFILQSCPELKRFDLSVSHEEFKAGGIIYLDFRGSNCLQHIKLLMPYCRYYSFTHAFGKYWKNINKELTFYYDHQSISIRKKAGVPDYYVQLAWDRTNKNIELDLSGWDDH